MNTSHKNKTLATLLAALLGAIGVHRWYLRGFGDRYAWMHAATLPLGVLGTFLVPPIYAIFGALPLILSGLIACIEALVLGLMPDEKWDATFNSSSGQTSESGWPVVLLVVLSLAGGAVGVIALISRCTDLILTGGNYG